MNKLTTINRYPLYVPITMVDQIRELFENAIKNYNPDEDVIGFKDGEPVTKKDLKQIKCIEL